MYYSNHPKIKILLAEVETEVAETESRIKSEERKKAMLSLTKNKWLWGGILFTVGAVLWVIASRLEGDLSESVFFLGLLVIGGGLVIMMRDSKS